MKKILIIDDDRDLLAVLGTLFTKNSYDVRGASSINEGLELLDTFLPDILFLDIHIGDSDGRELSQLMHAEANAAPVPVILISGDAEKITPHNLYGAVAFLQKPFTDKAILKIINTYARTVSSPNLLL